MAEQNLLLLKPTIREHLKKWSTARPKRPKPRPPRPWPDGLPGFCRGMGDLSGRAGHIYPLAVR